MDRAIARRLERGKPPRLLKKTKLMRVGYRATNSLISGSGGVQKTRRQKSRKVEIGGGSPT